MAEQNDEVAARPFADFLREHAKGATHDELSEALQEVTRAVVATEKGGSVSLTIKIEPMDKHNTDALKVTDKIQVKIPEHGRKASVFFHDDHGRLSRSDPNQLTFETLQEVPREPDAKERATGEAVADAK